MHSATPTRLIHRRHASGHAKAHHATGQAKAIYESSWVAQHCSRTVKDGQTVTKCRAATSKAEGKGKGPKTTAHTHAGTTREHNAKTKATRLHPTSPTSAGSKHTAGSPGSGHVSPQGAVGGGAPNTQSPAAPAGSGQVATTTGDAPVAAATAPSDAVATPVTVATGNTAGLQGTGALVGSPETGTLIGSPVSPTASAVGLAATDSVLYAVPSTSAVPYSVIGLTNSAGSVTGFTTVRLAAAPSAGVDPLPQSASDNSSQTRNIAAVVAPAVVGGVLGLLLLSLAVFCGLGWRRRRQQAELDAMGFGYASGAELSKDPSPRFRERPFSFIANVRKTFRLKGSRRQRLTDAPDMQQADSQARPSISPFEAGYGPGAQALAAGLAPFDTARVVQPRPSEEESYLKPYVESRGTESIMAGAEEDVSEWHRGRGSSESLASPTSEAISRGTTRSKKWW